MNIIMYAIREIGTDNYIPDAKTGRSWVDPMPMKGQVFPRLFTKKAHAKGWITNWRKGAVVVTRVFNNQWDDHGHAHLTHADQPKRQNVELTIEPVQLVTIQESLL